MIDDSCDDAKVENNQYLNVLLHLITCTFEFFIPKSSKKEGLSFMEFLEIIKCRSIMFIYRRSCLYIDESKGSRISNYESFSLVRNPIIIELSFY